MSGSISIALNVSLLVAVVSSVVTAVLADSWIEVGFSAAVVVSLLVVKLLDRAAVAPRDSP